MANCFPRNSRSFGNLLEDRLKNPLPDDLSVAMEFDKEANKKDEKLKKAKQKTKMKKKKYEEKKYSKK